MLLWNLGHLLDDPLHFIALMIVVVVALLVAITFHEASHALAAHWLGDDTAKRAGRLSLNPFAHLDPWGTLMLFLVGFGWGKPVPVNPYYLSRGPRAGMGMVASAGPLSNFILAFLFALLVRFGAVLWPTSLYPASPGDVASILVTYIVIYNILLAVFNLIPIAPLDGFKIAVWILPRNLAESLARTERYGPGILFAFVILIYLTGFLWDILIHVINFFVVLFTGNSI
jgi:Zn-dependent protease